MNILVVEVLVLILTVFGQTFGEHGDLEHHLHHKSHNRKHNKNLQAKHHKGLKARKSEICENICDIELLAVSKWINATKELHFLYQIIPPSIKNSISNPNSDIVTTTTESSGSLFNGSLPVDLDTLYNATENWPILTYLLKLFAHFLSRARRLTELFKMFPEFGNLWKILLHALSGQCSEPEIFLDNLRELFGFNGPIGGNLFNFTYWEHVFSPSGIAEGIEHAINKLPNLTNFLG